ncbi:ash family protein, partial [Enterobacter roggenkampii]|uniref:ash family protein n=1 Tax=Enterobacter roggenkampii TaxID=1812935 RepID=UPI001A8D147C
MMMTIQQTVPFSGLLPVAISRYSFPAVAKSAAGICSPCNSMATPDAPCVFFFVVAQTHPFFGLWCLHRGSCQIMVVRAGQPSGWPVSIVAGFSPPSGLPPLRENFGGSCTQLTMEVAAMAT